jgi:general secretion pathway protein C
MLARLSAFVIWALVAATAVFWGLRLFVTAPAAPSYAVAVGDSNAVRSDLSRLLGSAPVATSAVAAPVTSSRFRLLGIVAPKYASAADLPSHGVALIAIDGKMPKAFVVGSRVDGDMLLKSVSLRTVSIGGGKDAPAITLELPLPAAAATGTLTAPNGGTAYASPSPSPAPFLPQQQPIAQPSVPPVAVPVPVPLALPEQPPK